MANNASRTLPARVVRRVNRILSKLAGIDGEIASPDPYQEAHHRAQTVFIHIPKTAGNSVAKLIYGTSSLAVANHTPASRYLAYSPALFERYLVFATVRHPWDRLQSAFHFLKRGGMTQTDRHWAGRNLANVEHFPDFVRSLRDDAERTRVMRYKHFVPQAEYVCGANGSIIVPHLVRVEHFESDMGLICQKLGVPFQMIRENAGELDARSRLREWSSDLEAICYEAYKRDYDLLGYRRKSENG